MRTLLLPIVLMACECPNEIIAHGSSQGPSYGDTFSIQVLISDALVRSTDAQGSMSAKVIVAAVELQDEQQVQITDCGDNTLSTLTGLDGWGQATMVGPMNGCSGERGCDQLLCAQFPDDDAERFWNVSVDVSADACRPSDVEVELNFEVL
ncbi:MAG: hypothetical protein ACI9MC_003067 [Kiritimatiellia bacterium]|jgi:hypothetical protein